MADPLSISASIAGLVTLADIVFDRLMKYIRAAKNATKETENLAKEINLLGGALNSLSRLARGLDDGAFDRKFRMYHIEACNEIFSEIDKKLKKLDGNSVKKKMVWPFSSIRVKEMLEDLSQHKQSINLALSANSMEILLRHLAREEDLQKTAAEIKADVEKTHEVASRIHRDMEREKVLRFFLKYNPQQNYEMSLKLRHPRTGTWLLDLPKFQTWLSTTDEKLWLSGIPGAGKTVLAGTIIEAALGKCNEKIAGAFFFCDYKDKKTQSPENILSALAYQIAIQKEEAYAILEEYYLSFHPQHGLPRSPEVEGLARVVGKMVELYDHVFLVVDGIDECGDLVPDVLESLHGISVDSENISIALLSRDESLIRDRLEDSFECERIAAHTEDVEEYVAAEIEERTRTRRLHIDDAELKGEIMQGLIDGAKGMFRWVACQLDHLCECVSDEACRKALRELPPNLNETYLRILQRIPRDKAPLVQLILHFTAFAEPPLTTEQLREILSVPKTGGTLTRSSRVRESAIQKLCSSLIRKSNNGLRFEFAHFSVQEFLRNADMLKDQFEPFLISEARFNRLIVVQCLNYLQLDNFKHAPNTIEDHIACMTKRNDEYPLYKYAAYYWLIYARNQWDDEEIICSAKLFFGRGRTAVFTSCFIQMFLYHGDNGDDNRITDYTEDIIAAVSCLIHKDFTPLHMACLLALPEVCRHLLETGADIEQQGPFGTPIKCAVGMFTVTELEYYGDLKDMCLGTTWKSRYSYELVEYLLEAGAKIFPSPVSPDYDTILLEYALEAMAYTGEICVVTLLLSRGLTVNENGIEIFEGILENWEPETTISEEYFQLFVEALNSMIGKSDIYRELCSLAWNFAVSQGFGFASDPKLVSPSISLTEEALKESIIAAARNNDLGALTVATEYSNLHLSDITDKGKRLLHITLQGAYYPSRLSSRVEMIETLIKAGCSFLQPDSEGHLPVHWWSSKVKPNEDEDEDEDKEWPVKVFLDHGVAVSFQDSKGRNLLHASVINSQILSSFLKYDNEANTIMALQMVDQEGFTPLSKALNERCAVSASILFELGGNNPKTWQSPQSPLLLAARANCEKVFKGLLAAGVTLPGSENATLTPLHYLGAGTSISFINYLKVLYPGACETRINDSIPLDVYMEQLLKQGQRNIDSLYTEAIIALFPSELHNRQEVWKQFTTIARDLAKNTIPRAEAGHIRWSYIASMLSAVVKELIDLGCLSSYEAASQKPALLLILEQFDGHFQSVDHLRPFAVEDLCDILSSTSRWSGFEANSLIIHLLKAAVSSNEVALVQLLLEKAVPPHQRIQDESALERACYSSTKVDTFRLLLDYTEKEYIDDTNEANDGMGLIHLLANAEGDTIDKITELIRRGANPNLRLGKHPNEPALVYHLNTGQTNSAITLLKLGADPTLADQFNFDACLEAAWSGTSTFLAKVLEMKTSSWQIDWKRCCHSVDLDIGRTSTYLSGVGALHLAAHSGNIDCLELYIKHDFLSDINSACDQMFTPLHCAALKGHVNIIKYLHRLGANINAHTIDGHIPLHLAVINNEVSAIETLLSLGSHAAVDKWGWSPYVYACKSKNQCIIDCFRDKGPQHIVQYTGLASSDFSDTPFGQKNDLARALEAAVIGGNMDLCRELFKNPYHLDIDLPSYGGCSPLLLAIRSGMLDIVQLLLNFGASTIACQGCGKTSIHEILVRKGLIPVFPQFLERYMDDGGNILGDYNNPVGTAIENDNTEALRIIFEHVQQNARHYADIIGEDWTKAVSILANNQSTTSKGYRLPPIHTAVSNSNLEVVKYLLDKGANVNTSNEVFELMPLLHIAVNSGADNRQELIDLLISQGALIDSVVAYGETPLLYASRYGRWDSAQTLLDAGADLTVLNNQSRNVLHMSAMESSSRHTKAFVNFLDLGVDSHHLDTQGVSPMHLAMSSNKLTLIMSRDCRVQDTAPYPWSILMRINGVPWITTSFSMFLKRISSDDLRRIANTEPRGCWSPLCLSACQGALMAIENLLTLGANLEFEGCPVGTALMAACSAGKLESVITLVRRGAILSYYGANGFRTALNKAKTPPHILQWLLVHRFTDQAKIKEEPHEGLVLNIRPWSGIVKAELVISEDLERRPNESSLEYWIYLMDQKKKLRGKVVPIVDKRRTVRPSNLIPTERVRIHPDGYEAPVAERS